MNHRLERGGRGRPVGAAEVIDAAGEQVPFTGEPLLRIRWSSTSPFQPLVRVGRDAGDYAEDSVYSFRVAKDRATPVLDNRVRLTAAYEAMDQRDVRWTKRCRAIWTPAYATHIWTPLPSHQPAGFAMEELAGLEETARAPLSYGPFVVDRWDPGDAIRLIPNPGILSDDRGLISPR